MKNTDRLDRLVSAMREQGMRNLLVAPSADMEYLVGVDLLGDERFTVLCVSAEGRHFIISPRISEGEFRSSAAVCEQIPIFFWTDNEGSQGAVERAFCEHGVSGTTLAVNDDVRAVDVVHLQDVYGLKLVVGGDLVPRLRMVKDAEEVACQKAVGGLADEVLGALAAYIRPGVSERGIQRVLRDAFEELGGEKVSWVIGSGPNGAQPHNTGTDRVVEAGDFVVVDFGAKYRGYRSDTTRTFAVGEPGAKQREVYETVLAAHLAGERFARPGVRACEVDAVVRRVIEEAGYGGYFTHRTGQGIGITTHEAPYISARDETVLEPGMSFSIEPGIYLPGEFGVRIEDCVTVTGNGCESFTHYPRELQVLA